MLLPAAWLIAPPAEVVNENVAATPAFAATRSGPAIEKVGLITLSPITPEFAPDDAVGSALVSMLTPVKFPAVAAPMVRPVTVTVTALLAAIAAVAVVMTICVPVGVAAVPVAPPPLIATPGVPVLEKKPDGYVSVMVLPVASAPPAEVVNDTVASAGVMPATRSDATISNVTDVTWEAIAIEQLSTATRMSSNH